jgi:heme ABC exporter ATP-binding subunit CcmA
MAGDGGVAGLSRHRGAGVVPGSLLQVGHADPFHDGLLEADLGDLEEGDRVARDQLGRGRVEGGQGAFEVALEVALGAGLAQVGAPQLVGGEEQHEHAEDDQGAPDGPDDDGRLGATRTAPIPFSPISMDPVVRFRAAVCLLGRFPALAGIDLDAEAGEVVLLRGPNGAGKTTLLRAIAGLVPVVRGEATVLGVDLRRDRKAVRRQVALLGHATGLYDDLTVAENVRFWARACRSGADVEAALARAGAGGRIRDIAVGRLSAGQRRRASLAALLVRDARLWLLDEPHAGLDAAGRDVLDGLIRDVAAAGTTVLFASHELERATPLADRQVLVAGGHAGAQHVA